MVVGATDVVDVVAGATGVVVVVVVVVGTVDSDVEALVVEVQAAAKIADAATATRRSVRFMFAPPTTHDTQPAKYLQRVETPAQLMMSWPGYPASQQPD